MESEKEFQFEIHDDEYWDSIAGLTGTEEGMSDSIIQLKPRHHKAISLLLRGFSQTQTANILGVTKQTLSRWMKPGSIFHEIYTRRCYDLWITDQRKQHILHSMAIETLSDILKHSDDRTRLNASKIILSTFHPAPPLNFDNLPINVTESYRFIRLHGGRYYKHCGQSYESKVSRGIMEQGLDPEDDTVKPIYEYEDDYFPWDYVDPDDKYSEEYPFKYIRLNREQLIKIKERLDIKDIFTELCDEEFTIRNRDKYVVAQLFPSNHQRYSVIRIDANNYKLYQSIVRQFFQDKNRPIKFDPPLRRSQIRIPEPDDLEELIDLLEVLGAISVPDEVLPQQSSDVIG